MNTPMTAPITGSTHVQPVSPHTTAATITPMDPSVSDITSRYAPRMLRLSLAPGAQQREGNHVDARPMTPTTITGNRGDVRRIANSSEGLEQHVSGDREQQHRVQQRGQNLEPVQPERALRIGPAA